MPSGPASRKCGREEGFDMTRRCYRFRHLRLGRTMKKRSGVSRMPNSTWRSHGEHGRAAQQLSQSGGLRGEKKDDPTSAPSHYCA